MRLPAEAGGRIGRDSRPDLFEIGKILRRWIAEIDLGWRWRTIVGGLERFNRIRKLRDVVDCLCPDCGCSRPLNSGKNNSNEQSDNGNDDKHFDECERLAESHVNLSLPCDVIVQARARTLGYSPILRRDFIGRNGIPCVTIGEPLTQTEVSPRKRNYGGSPCLIAVS